MYFECSSGTGKGNNLIVTCASDFAGVTITCTNGVKTYSRICPSSDPYEIEFSGLESGTWTISGTVEGTLYSTNVVIADYTATLDSGFDYKTWCTEGGVYATQYSSLADVFADELAVCRLMTVHASADYLIEAVTDDIDVIDDFVANDTAMKWIGLRDYVCDGLTAINGVEAKLLASTYWERYLKDHVPTMTSNSAPYGTVSLWQTYQNAEAYKVFDGNDSTRYIGQTANSVTDCWFEYQFATPICIKAIKVRPQSAVSGKGQVTAYTLYGSNDGSTYTDIQSKSGLDFTANTDNFDTVTNDDYYLRIRFKFNQTGEGNNFYPSISTLQFYGRSLSVSVPKMTSNTAPFGEVTADSGSSNRNSVYTIFSQTTWADENTPSTNWNCGTNHNPTVVFKFNSKVNVKMVDIMAKSNTYKTIYTFNLIASNDGETFETIRECDMTPHTTTSASRYQFTNTSNGDYQYWGIEVTEHQGSYAIISHLQFYGVDYSEKEFEAGTTRKWIYDHGVELETLTTSGSVTKGDDYLTLSAANSEATATIDLTDYNLLRGKCGDHLSGTTQLSVGGSSPATATLTTNYAPNNFSLGTSLFDQPLATGVKMTANGICDITELWLE